MSKKGSAKSSKIFSVIEGIIIAIFILFIAGMLFLYFTFSDAGAAPTIFGHIVYQTKAVNMQPAINKDDAVIGKSSAAQEAKAGEVVLCKLDDRIVVARIDSIINENGTLYYNVKFDTAAANDIHRIAPTDLIAGDIHKSVPLGRLLSFATSTLGIMLVIIIPSFVIIVLQIIKIVNSKHSKEEAVNLDELNDIMRSSDYPEETFLPISQGVPLNTEHPEGLGDATEIAFVNNRPVSPILEDAPADLDSEKSVSFAGPTAVDIFTEDEEFFAEKPQKDSYNVFGENMFANKQAVPEETPPPPPSPDSILAAEFYGITEEVRSHQEKRRIEEEAASGNAFEDPFDSKADSILSGIDETLIEPEESEETDKETISEEQNASAEFLQIPEETEYTEEPVSEAVPEPVQEGPVQSGYQGYDFFAPSSGFIPGTIEEAVPAEDMTMAESEPAPEPEAAAEEPAADISPVVMDIPSRGEEPVQVSEPAEAPAKTVKVRKVIKKKREKVSVDDLLNMIDEEETKINS